MKIFAMKSSEHLGRKIAHSLELPLSNIEITTFEDGETKIRSLENVRNHDIYLIQSLCGDPAESVNDKFCKILFFIQSLKDASCRKITCIFPYFCYSRKDRRSHARDPVITKYTSVLLEAAGADQIITMDIHNLQAFQNAFRIPCHNIEAGRLFATYLTDKYSTREIVIASPDTGGIKRAEFLQRLLLKNHVNASFAFIEKFRTGGKIRGGSLIGDVGGKIVVITDDLISTGGTIAKAAESCRMNGAEKVIAMAAHGLFTEGAEEHLSSDAIDKIVITDSVFPPRIPEKIRMKTTEVSCSEIFGDAIRRMEAGISLSEMIYG